MAIFFSSFEFPLIGVRRRPIERTGDGDLRVSYPSYLCSEALYMVLFPLEDILGNEHWESAIPDSYTLDLVIEPVLYLLPDEK